MPPFLRDCAALLSRWRGHRVRKESAQGEATADASRAETRPWADRVMAFALMAALALVFLRAAIVAPDVAEHICRRRQ
jgi:hypothetical protein